MRRPDYRPLLITGAVSVAGLAMLLLGTAYGWLGPDRDYGDQFCEVAHWRYFAQPANTLSNLGFVAAGLALAWRARWPGAHLTPPSLTTPFAVIVALLGPASMAMHATESALGGQLDVLSMQLLASFAAAHGLARVWGKAGPTGGRLGPVLFIAFLAVSTYAALRGGRVPLVHHAGNGAFAVMLLAAFAAELRLARRASLVPWWGLGAVASIVIAFVIWVPSQTGRAWCDPTSWIQGHAAWHLLGALAAYLLGRHYTAFGAQPSRD